MDLSHLRFDRYAAVPPPVSFAVMMVGVASRQATSPTARAQAAMEAGSTGFRRFAPVDGRFSPAVAASLAVWKQE